MEKEFLVDCIDKDMSVYQISKVIKKAPNTVTYWLNKFELKTNHKSFKDKGILDYGGERECPRCTKTKPLSEYYDRRGKKGSSVYCKPCTTDQSTERQRNLKQLAIDYKGGGCEVCGYDKYNGALDFHHIDPTEKDFNISKITSYTFTDKVKAELDKCALVCSNCHREIYGGVIEL